ncbi:VWA domain-containing protein [Candidatus Woesearchaeota archaeon]|nr:VWA domain-containing protein [Candidatus Woesearchaeota archaeon]
MVTLEPFIKDFGAPFVQISNWFQSTFPGVSGHFMQPAAILLLLMLIPFFMIYLIRPKPNKKMIPSLMFFFKDKGKSRLKSFLRKFIQDPLFLIQLIIIILLAVTAARPFIEVNEKSLLKDTVVVVDVSASMQAEDLMSQAKNIAKDSLGSTNTIILAGSYPEVVVEKVGKAEARMAIESIKTRDTKTDLFSALIEARNYVSKEGSVFLISDMVDSVSNPEDFKNVKLNMEAQGIKVYFEKITAKNTNNAGIVDMSIGDETTSISVRNFNNKDLTVRMKLNGELIETLNMASLSTEKTVIQTPPGLSEITINVEDKEYDNLEVDNTAYISAPETSKANVLIITNNENIDKSLTKYAVLDSISQTTNLELVIETAYPPKIPEIVHDLIIIQDVETEKFLPGKIKEIKEQVEQGAGAIIFVQDDLFQIDFQGLLPVQYKGKADDADIIKVESPLTQDLDMGSAKPVYIVEAVQDSTPLAMADLEEPSPLIVLAPLGEGRVLYYGLFDKTSDFRVDVRYPIFWKNVINLLLQRQNLNVLNRQTGEIINLPEKIDVKLPDNRQAKTNIIDLKTSGIYTTPKVSYSANLLSERESDIGMSKEVETEIGGIVGETGEKKVPKELLTAFLIACISALMIELLFVKYRGDF